MRALTLIPLFLFLLACNSKDDLAAKDINLKNGKSTESTDDPLRLAVIEKLKPFFHEVTYDCASQYEYIRAGFFKLNGVAGTKVEGLFYIKMDGTFTADFKYYNGDGCSEGDGFSICRQYLFDTRYLEGKWSTKDGESVIFEDFGVATFRNKTTMDLDVTEKRMPNFTFKHWATIVVKEKFNRVSYGPGTDNCKK